MTKRDMVKTSIRYKTRIYKRIYVNIDDTIYIQRFNIPYKNDAIPMMECVHCYIKLLLVLFIRDKETGYYAEWVSG